MAARSRDRTSAGFLERWPGPARRGRGEPRASAAGDVTLRPGEAASLNLHAATDTLFCSVGEGIESVRSPGLTSALSAAFGGLAEGLPTGLALERVPGSLRALAEELLAYLVDRRVLAAVAAEPPPLPALAPSRRGTRVTYLGHSSILVETASSAVLVDPMLFALAPMGWRLLPRRQGGPGGSAESDIPVPLSALPSLSAIAISHNHEDHLDPFTLMWLDKSIPVVLPRIKSHLKSDVARLGFERIELLEAWRAAGVGDVTITRVPSSLAYDHRSRPTEQCCWHVRTPDVSVYCGTDTRLRRAPLRRIAGELGADLAFLPVSGHVIAGRKETMDDADALEAARVLTPGLAVPYSAWDHWWLPETSESFHGSRPRFVDAALAAGFHADLALPGTAYRFEGGRRLGIERPRGLSAEEVARAVEISTMRDEEGP